METIIETEEEREERIQKWRLNRALREAPELLAHVRGMAVSGGVDRGEVLREQTAPVRLRPLSDSDSVYAQIIDWVISLAEQLHLAPPAPSVLAWNVMDPDDAWDDYRGFRAATTPEEAALLTRIQTLWIVGHLTTIEAWPGYGRFREDLLDILWRLRSRYPMAARKERGTTDRECPACGELSVSASWWSEDVHDVEVSCAGCGYRLEPHVKVRIGEKRVGVLDLLDWETRENRECTCLYPGDPLSDCPVHHPDTAKVTERPQERLSQRILAPAPRRAPVPVRLSETVAEGIHLSALKRSETVCGACFIVKPCACDDGQ